MFCALLGQYIRCAFTGQLVLWFLTSYLDSGHSGYSLERPKGVGSNAYPIELIEIVLTLTYVSEQKQ